MRTKTDIFTAMLCLFFISCSKEDDAGLTQQQHDDQILQNLDLPATPYPYSRFDLLPLLKTPFEKAQDNMPADNPTTDWGATLGRVLFYEKGLSENHTIACGSCHHQALGFADTARYSAGFEGGKTKRKSMGLSNARYYASGKFFWDERVATLEDQVLMPVQDKVEMGMTLEEVRLRLSQVAYYPILFTRAFGDASITNERISRALAQFVRSIISCRSKFDAGLQATHGDPVPPFPNFTPSENRGKEIFFTNKDVPCAGCHITRAIVMDNPRNNGTYDDDEGAFAFNPLPQLRGAFKAPSLRNIALHPPYMHGGNLPNLEAVVEHYNSGLTNPDNTLDPHLAGPDNTGARMHLSAIDKQALVDFLNALTDESLLHNPAYADPFR